MQLAYEITVRWLHNEIDVNEDILVWCVLRMLYYKIENAVGWSWECCKYKLENAVRWPWKYQDLSMILKKDMFVKNR